MTNTEKANIINEFLIIQGLSEEIKVNPDKELSIEVFGKRAKSWRKVYKSQFKQTFAKYGFTSMTNLLSKAKKHLANLEAEKIKEPSTPETQIHKSVTQKSDNETVIVDDIQISSVPKSAQSQLVIWRQWKETVKNKGLNFNQYTTEDVQLARSFSGLGGLISKHGEELKKELGIKKMTGILDQFFTPYEVIEKMWSLAFKYGFHFKNAHILEPSCGNGRFLEYIPKDNNVVAFEPDKNPFVAAKISFPNFDVRNDVLESLFYRNNNPKIYVGLPRQKFDLVIGNPPYRKFITQFTDEKKHTLAQTYDQYFITRGLDLLKIGGLLVFIVPNSFIRNADKYNDFKEKLKAKSELLEAYRLPNSIFPNTDIGTDILIFKKI